MSTSEAMEIVRRWGRKGAEITNAKRTFEGRSKASKKGWRLRKRRLKEFNK